MPRKRHSKGPRLWFEPASTRRDGSVRAGTWYILDTGGVKRSTGCGAEDRGEAEAKLADYIAEKRVKTRERDRASAQIPVADVLAIYAADVAPGTARPKETAARIERLLAFWGTKTLAEVTGSTCRDYARERGSRAAARRELEDLRAAIIHHRDEGLCREVVEVVLPEKSEPRGDWLTRDQVAALMFAAWRYREMQKGKETDRRSRRHVARFMLIARYTGTRAGAICKSSFEQKDGFGWIDLEHGVWYRRPEGERETKKRKPPIRLPGPLLAFMRRWRKAGQKHPVEFNGKPILDCDKAFRKVAIDAKVAATPHTFRHTCATWMMQNGADKWEAAGYLGMTEETLDRVYGHHHPDHFGSAIAAVSRRKHVEKIDVTEREQARTKVVSIGKKR